MNNSLCISILYNRYVYYVVSWNFFCFIKCFSFYFCTYIHLSFYISTLVGLQVFNTIWHNNTHMNALINKKIGIVSSLDSIQFMVYSLTYNKIGKKRLQFFSQEVNPLFLSNASNLSSYLFDPEVHCIHFSIYQSAHILHIYTQLRSNLLNNTIICLHSYYFSKSQSQSSFSLYTKACSDSLYCNLILLVFLVKLLFSFHCFLFFYSIGYLYRLFICLSLQK